MTEVEVGVGVKELQQGPLKSTKCFTGTKLLTPLLLSTKSYCCTLTESISPATGKDRFTSFIVVVRE